MKKKKKINDGKKIKSRVAITDFQVERQDTVPRV